MERKKIAPVTVTKKFLVTVADNWKSKPEAVDSGEGFTSPKDRAKRSYVAHFFAEGENVHLSDKLDDDTPIDYADDYLRIIGDCSYAGDRDILIRKDILKAFTTFKEEDQTANYVCRTPFTILGNTDIEILATGKKAAYCIVAQGHLVFAEWVSIPVETNNCYETKVKVHDGCYTWYSDEELFLRHFVPVRKHKVISVSIKGEDKEIWEHTYSSGSKMFTYRLTEEESARFTGRRVYQDKNIISSSRMKRLRMRISHTMSQKDVPAPNSRMGLFRKLQKTLSRKVAVPPWWSVDMHRFNPKMLKKGRAVYARTVSELKEMLEVYMSVKPIIKALGMRTDIVSDYNYIEVFKAISMEVTINGSVRLKFSAKGQFRGTKPSDDIEKVIQYLIKGYDNYVTDADLELRKLSEIVEIEDAVVDVKTK